MTKTTPTLSQDIRKRFLDNFGFLYKLVERMGLTKEVNWGEKIEEWVAHELTLAKAGAVREERERIFKVLGEEKIKEISLGKNSKAILAESASKLIARLLTTPPTQKEEI